LATQNITTTAAARTLSFYGTGTVTLSGTHSATVVGTGAYPTRTTYTYTPTAGTLTLTVSGTVQYAQDELGSFATSFIPTGSSSVTRAADVAVIQGSNFYSWYNQNEGSVYANFSFASMPSGNYPSPFSILDTTALGTVAPNRIQFYRNDVNTALGFDVTTLNSSQANITFTGLTLTNLTKAVGAYKINDFSASANGVLGTPDTSGNTGIYSQLLLGRATQNSPVGCCLKTFSYYNTRLPNSTLQSLTS
jgi:hypothetical protein